MTEEQAKQRATEMIASGQYDKASAAPVAINSAQWFIQARTKEGRDVEIR